MARLDFKTTDVGPRLLWGVSRGPNLKNLADVLKYRRAAASDARIAPYTSVARLEFRNNGERRCVGTGFLVRPDIVLTVKHNLQVAGEFDEIEVVFGCDRVAGAGITVPVLHYGWHGKRDMAVLQIPTVDLQPFLPAFITGAPAVVLAGYPSFSHRLLLGEGPLRASGTTGIYEVDAQEGDSGAPVFVRAASGEHRVVCMHVANKWMARKGGTLTNAGIGDLFNDNYVAAFNEVEKAVRSGGAKGWQKQ